MITTYINRETKERYILGGIKDIGDAWSKARLVCSRMNWNEETFSKDVTVTVK